MVFDIWGAFYKRFGLLSNGTKLLPLLTFHQLSRWGQLEGDFTKETLVINELALKLPSFQSPSCQWVDNERTFLWVLKISPLLLWFIQGILTAPVVGAHHHDNARECSTCQTVQISKLRCFSRPFNSCCSFHLSGNLNAESTFLCNCFF